MPKLPNESIRIETKADGNLTFDLSVHVSTSGIFSVSIPEEIYETAKHLRENDPEYASLEIQYGRKGKCVVSATLKKGVAFVEAAAEAHYAVETKEECVLAYKYASGLAYWKNRDGSITHNGSANDADHKGGWAGALRDEQRDSSCFGIALQALAMVKRTHTRGTSVTTEWDLWRHESHFDDDDIRSRLNSISPGGMPDDPSYGGWVIIPYSEQAAGYFYRAIHSLCVVDDRLRAFFRDDTKVQKSIAAGVQFQLTGNISK